MKTCRFKDIFYIDNLKCLSIPVECPQCGALVELETYGENSYLTPEHNISVDPAPSVKRWKRFGTTGNGWDWRIVATQSERDMHLVFTEKEDAKEVDEEENKPEVPSLSNASASVKTPPVKIIHGSAIDVLNSFLGENA